MGRPRELLQADRTAVLVPEALLLVQRPERRGKLVPASRRPRPAPGNVLPEMIQPNRLVVARPAHVQDDLLVCSCAAVPILQAPEVSVNRSDHDRQDSAPHHHLGTARGQCEVDARLLAFTSSKDSTGKADQCKRPSSSLKNLVVQQLTAKTFESPRFGFMAKAPKTAGAADIGDRTDECVTA
eukprot:CAMPEP_0177492984 /NCGR_PEP_ID=MMETSP0369-20130122/32650_1 /TAXON_ID=447022 ORGANISM="Scrippsiella hangoei-like, Strain SHHI-4" /NCGR_SAMPLE_ID=MMETSP0369 /ASSEMBLY_ACC=CAM_ASM_000364 /LENGTH=182 /DNA_ID=CAMNT_0018969795 /DNA_START=300 /DNA_END=846 /DNA_ORIENTATION=+